MKKIFFVLIILVSLNSPSAYCQGYSGLVGRWTFNGDANDVSGNGLNGIVRGATLTAGINGLPNTAYLFNGTSDYITVPYNSLMNTKIHSFCALLKPMGFYPYNSQGNSVIWRGDDISGTFSYQLEFFDNAYDNSDLIYSPTQDVFAGWTGSTTSRTPQTDWYYTPTVDSGLWYAVVLTYDGNSTKIYVNSVLMDSFYNTCTYTSSTDSLNFGKSEDRPSYEFWFNGVLDEIRFYNRVLSPSEVGMFTDSSGIANNIFPIELYLDADGDCVKEGTEKYNTLPVSIQVSANGVPMDTVSATSKIYYHATGGNGTVYSFKVISSPPGIYVSCPSSGILVDTISSTASAPKYFGLSCAPSTNFDLQVDLAVSTDPKNETVCMLVNNNYCSPTPTTLTLNFSPKLNFGSSTPVPSSVIGNTVTWNLGSISYMNSPASIRLNLPPAGGALSAGDTFYTKCVVNPTTGDINPSNNTIDIIDTVRICHDPNQITVAPGCTLSNAVSTLQYTIIFENTGNDTAHNIYIMDTLSDNLNASSLNIVTASGPMGISKWYDCVSHNIYEFSFPDINLLDSSHHNQCEGMIVFNIDTKSGLGNGDEIFNHAGIFFDSNAVVMTDTAKTVIGCPKETTITLLTTTINASGDIQIFPNPALNSLTVTCTQKIASLTVTNPLGQVIYSQRHDTKEAQIDVSTLPAGVYFVKVNGMDVRKFVKQ